MSPRGRRTVFLVAAGGLLALLLWSFAGLPDFAQRPGSTLGHTSLGALLNEIAVPERQATAVVTAVTFDFRGLDALGEEFILFASVAGVATILRQLRGERERRPDDDARGRRVRETSAAVSVLGLLIVGPTILIGLYIVAHGHQTPGGGFTGGVILATALLLTYLSDQYVTLRRVAPVTLLEVAEAGGTAGFTLIGIAGLVWGSAFLANVLPLGEAGELLSAGTIPVGNVAVGLAVTGAFAFMLSEFLDQTLVIRRARAGRRRS